MDWHDANGQAQDEALKRDHLAKAKELLRTQKRTPERDQELGQSL